MVLASLTALAGTDSPKIKVGAYYFDGWSGQTDALHLTDRLKSEFAHREPVWGWHDNTPAIMQEQINLAADAGITFWSFCWFWPDGADKKTPLNNALDLYLKAANRGRLGFSLMIANHGGFTIRPVDWPAVTAQWISYFKQSGYVTVSGKPLLIFYSPGDLIQKFGGAPGLKQALDKLRSDAQSQGLQGVTVAACCLPGPDNGWNDLKLLSDAGFDAFTGYNYIGANLQGVSKQQHFADLMVGYHDLWDLFAKKSAVPYIPVIATGWDTRPWEPPGTTESQRAIYYPDRSPTLVQQFTENALRWTAQHPQSASAERLLMIYAWNENGEGAYLTPTKAEGDAYLKAVAQALASERSRDRNSDSQSHPR